MPIETAGTVQQQNSSEISRPKRKYSRIELLLLRDAPMSKLTPEILNNDSSICRRFKKADNQATMTPSKTNRDPHDKPRNYIDLFPDFARRNISSENLMPEPAVVALPPPLLNDNCWRNDHSGKAPREKEVTIFKDWRRNYNNHIYNWEQNHKHDESFRSKTSISSQEDNGRSKPSNNFWDPNWKSAHQKSASNEAWNHQENTNSKPRKYSDSEGEPEWYTAGPTSRLETIELGGFDGPEGDDDEKPKDDDANTLDTSTDSKISWRSAKDHMILSSSPAKCEADLNNNQNDRKHAFERNSDKSSNSSRHGDAMSHSNPFLPLFRAAHGGATGPRHFGPGPMKSNPLDMPNVNEIEDTMKRRAGSMNSNQKFNVNAMPFTPKLGYEKNMQVGGNQQQKARQQLLGSAFRNGPHQPVNHSNAGPLLFGLQNASAQQQQQQNATLALQLALLQQQQINKNLLSPLPTRHQPTAAASIQQQALARLLLQNPQNATAIQQAAAIQRMQLELFLNNQRQLLQQQQRLNLHQPQQQSQQRKVHFQQPIHQPPISMDELANRSVADFERMLMMQNMKRQRRQHQ